jgi:hypothetical protein
MRDHDMKVLFFVHDFPETKILKTPEIKVLP